MRGRRRLCERPVAALDDLDVDHLDLLKELRVELEAAALLDERLELGVDALDAASFSNAARFFAIILIVSTAFFCCFASFFAASAS